MSRRHTASDDPVAAVLRDTLCGELRPSSVSEDVVTVAVDRVRAVAESVSPREIPAFVVDVADGLLRALARDTPDALDGHIIDFVETLDTTGSQSDLSYCPDCYETFVAADHEIETCHSCGSGVRRTAGGTTVTPQRPCWCGERDRPELADCAFGCADDIAHRTAEDCRNSVTGHLALVAAADDAVGQSMSDRLSEHAPAPPTALLDAVARTAVLAPRAVRSAVPTLRSVATRSTSRATRSAAQVGLLVLATTADDPAAVVGDIEDVANRLLSDTDSELDRTLALAATGRPPGTDALRDRPTFRRRVDGCPGTRALVDALHAPDTDSAASELKTVARAVPGLVAPVIPRLLDAAFDDRAVMATIARIAPHDPSATRPARDATMEYLDEYPGNVDAVVTLSHLATAVDDPKAFLPTMARFIAQTPEMTRLPTRSVDPSSEPTTIVHDGKSDNSDRCIRHAMGRYLAAFDDGTTTEAVVEGLKELARPGNDTTETT